MVLINEVISKHDRDKFCIDEIDNRFIIGGTRSKQWTINKNKDIYLRNVARGREDLSHMATWYLYIKGRSFIVEIENISTEELASGHNKAVKRIVNLSACGDFNFNRDDVVDVLRKALSIYMDFGIYSVSKTYCLHIDDH